MSVRTIFALSALFVAAGCSNPTSQSNTAPAARIAVAAGDRQIATPGVELPGPLVVRVADAAGGLSGVPVTWRVTVGSGDLLSPAVSPTDASGQAQMRFRPTSYRARLVASIAGGLATAWFETLPPQMAMYTQLGSLTACGNLCQRYTFYPDGTLLLEYPDPGYAYPGTYTRQGAEISMRFPLGPGYGTASGTIRADTLQVSYSLEMQMSDFANALLVAQSSDPAWSPRP